jgi:ring-1,2-phenylacetyl-CoA epoxidase subunit PaaD
MVTTATLSSADPLEREARPRPDDPKLAALWDVAATVVDPEVPVLTIADLGVLRDVHLEGDVAVVRITPTYSGCPAIDALRADIVSALGLGGRRARVDVVLSPAWTTDWMSDEGRRKLEEFGIAPPRPRSGGARVSLGLGIRCPRCGSLHTREVSRYGSTSCKALWQCQSCSEPFDRFKEL